MRNHDGPALAEPGAPSPETSKALVAAFAEGDIEFMPNRRVTSVDPGRRVASLDDGQELSYDLLLGVPKHRAPAVVEASGMAEAGWVPVNPRTLGTKFPNVYAVGDIANTGTPKAGVSRIRGEGEGSFYGGAGSCYIEFGTGRIGRVDVNFFSRPKSTGTYYEPNVALRVDKERFGARAC
jgi:sulfide:quinone oxidoreductase